MNDLLKAISEIMGENFIEPVLTLTPKQGKLRARFYHHGMVKQETVDDLGNIQLELRLQKEEFIRMLNEERIDPLPYLKPVTLNSDDIARQDAALP